MIKNELMPVPPMEKQLEFKSFIMRIDKLKNISGHKKRPPASLPMAKKRVKVYSCFLLLVRAFYC